MAETKQMQQEPPRPARHQVRRRSLPAANRGEFDRLLLAGEDINRLARRFGIEPWDAKRRALRVLARPQGHANPLPEPEMTPTEYARSLLRSRVTTLPGGCYLLDGRYAGPRELLRAANQHLRARGLPEINYPGLQLRQG